MTPERLSILCVSHLPPSPPRFGAQARIHGLMTQLGRRHDLTAISLIDEEFNVEECRRAMLEYCREVVLVPRSTGPTGLTKRMLQLRSVASAHSFEYHYYTVPALQPALDRLLQRSRFDIVNLEFPYLAHFQLRGSPPGTPAPAVVIDAHEIAYDLVRQFGKLSASLARKLYAALNWRKLRSEELSAFRSADGVYSCSIDDEKRILGEVPSARTVVIPNAADVEFFQPRPSDPAADGRTIVFFGLLSTVPNVDGLLWFLREIWPRISAARPEARLKVLGKGAPQSVLAQAGPSVEVVGFVEDLRPRLASAAVLVVPLRLGGGTRLKIVEGMAMGKAIVSTTLGAEGIDVVPERDLLIADDPGSFAASVVRLLEDPGAVARLGAAARTLAVERYAWSVAASTLERFYRVVLDRPRSGVPRA
jgi:glycosyltransferase involved in cell wall biosynthesis